MTELSVSEIESAIADLTQSAEVRTQEVVQEQAAPVEETPCPFPTEPSISVEQIQADLAWNSGNLDDKIRTHAGFYVLYAAKAAQALRAWKSKKAQFDVTEAELNRLYRDRAAASGAKITEASLEASVRRDTHWLEAKEAEIEAEAIYNLAENAVVAFKHRKDCLLAEAYERRSERNAELRVYGARQEESDEARRAVLQMVAGR